MSTDPYLIPKRIHQVWIGDQSKRPQVFLNSWREKHPDWEYILWTEEEIAKRNILFHCQKQIDDIYEINGKADIIRWEVLYRYGGVAMDADSFCLETMEPDIFLTKNGWASYENEHVRKGLVACGAMGFPAGHPLLRDLIEHISQKDLRVTTTREKAWMTVANLPFTQFLKSGRYPDFSVFLSHTFIPEHFTGVKYSGHKKVYAYQEWGSTKQSYHTMNNVVIPKEYSMPQRFVSVIIPSYNTDDRHVRDCLESIQNQIGYFGIELVWVNDGSDEEHSQQLERRLQMFQKTTRHCKVQYLKMEVNEGTSTAFRKGIELSDPDNEYIFRMDSDDIMVVDRLQKQMEFMDKSPDAFLCGGQISFFHDLRPDAAAAAPAAPAPIPTKHPLIVKWKEYQQNPSSWFMNHPTLCWRRSTIQELDGGYKLGMRIMEDFEIELRALKKFGHVYNLPDVLVKYRLHPHQLTHKMNEKPEVHELRQQIIKNILFGTSGDELS